MGRKSTPVGKGYPHDVEKRVEKSAHILSLACGTVVVVGETPPGLYEKSLCEPHGTSGQPRG